MQDLTHETIKGYHLLEQLGSGGFGAVYKASQSSVGRDVAIKIILPGLANQPEFIRRFETEAQVIARLEHPSIVPLYDYWRDPDGAYLVMRWLRGGSLSDLLKRGALDLETIARILDQVAAALTLAHRGNIVHRDIKPGNILLDEDGNAYLADFGIAKDLKQPDGSGTQMDAIVGSLDYMSPEQARSEPVTSRTDIYSLGVVLYEMLTGKHPFPGISSIERLYKHINDPLPDMTGLHDSLRDNVNAVVQKATAKNPLHRYETVTEFAAHFKDAAGLNRVTSGDTVVELLRQREHEVLSLLVAGRSNKEIAQKLVVTLPTVKWYINEIYRKLRVRTRVQAIIRARELDLILPAGATGETAPSVSTSNLPEPENPYKGLRAFQAADERDFFGREDLVQKLLKRLTPSSTLTRSEDDARFLAVVGPSGSGKSSVVKAGLVPALLRGGVPGSERWFVVEMLPGTHPYHELEVALMRVTSGQVPLRDLLTRDERGLLQAANLILPQDDSELVIVIDQFEEVFTLVGDESVRANFLKLLLATVTEKRSRVRIMITLRADFYDRPLNYPEFGELLKNHMETILPLSAKGIERAIAEPAKRAGVMFEDGLIATIVGDINYQAGALPLLQYALTELFEQRQERRITHEAYHAIGGAVGALAKRAEAIYQELSPEAQSVTRQMFLRLATPGDGTEDTRRRAARAELAAISPDPDVLDEVIDIYANYRLLALDHDPATRTPTIEVAHEALLREWERLRGWLNENRDDIRQERNVAQAAGDWHNHARDTSYLPDGSRLEAMVVWHNETNLALTPLEREFIAASIALRDARKAADEARQGREIRLERRSRQFLRSLVVVLLMATVGALLLSGAAINNANAAQIERDHALENFRRSESQRLAAEANGLFQEVGGNVELAALLSVQAMGKVYTSQADKALEQAARYDFGEKVFDPPGNEVYSAAFTPDGTSILISTDKTVQVIDAQTGQESLTLVDLDAVQGMGAVMSPDGNLIFGFGPGIELASTHPAARLWDAHTGKLLYEVQTSSINDAAFSSDSRYIVTAGFDGAAILWDAATGQSGRIFTAHEDGMLSVSFSPDGRFILTSSYNAPPRLWDVATGAEVHQLSAAGGFVFATAFSPDGRYAAAGGGDNLIHLWDMAAGREVRTFAGHSDIVSSLNFSPDSRLLLSGSLDRSARLWDVTTGQPIHVFSGHTAQINEAAFSPDSRQIITAALDGTVRLWDMQAKADPNIFSGHTDWVSVVAFTPDSKHILSGSLDTTARVWDIQSGELMVTFTGHSGIINGAGAVAPNGQYAATGGGGSMVPGQEGGIAIVWDIETGETIQTLIGHTALIARLAFSPDSRYVVTSSDDQSARLWDIETGETVQTFSGHTGYVGDVVFMPDGKSILTGSVDGTARRWDIETGQTLQTFSADAGSVDAVAAAADGKLIMISDGRVMHIIDVATGERLHTLVGHTEEVTDAVFSPDSRLLLSGSFDRTARLWDVQTGQQVRLFAGSGGCVCTVDFSPDGQFIATGSGDQILRLWHVRVEDLVDFVCSRVRRDLTEDQRAQYDIDDTSPTCSQFAAG